ncbi:MAG: formate dehydrogenase subunit alpha [Helicobacteraceae bacterium]|nr:formate dehydrogenase subunit alpha [Helicobacteraceae bacterium]
MTNHIADMINSKFIFIIGANPAVNHPVSMVHILRAKEAGAKIVCVDPYYSKTAAKANEFIRIRSGTDVALIYGMLNVIIANNLYDKQYLQDRVYGYEEIFKEAKKYTPEITADITGIPADTIIRIAKEMARAKPASLIWNQGLTQHTVGTNNTRIMPILQAVLGNIGKKGGGVNILRGHDNVQGASDMNNLSDSLPGYYGLGEGPWRHFCKHWHVDYEWMKSRFKSKEMMEKTGYALSTWRFGVIDEENYTNNADTQIKALIVIGNGISTTSLLDKTKEALDKLELVVFIDPYVNDAAVITDRKDNLFLLPAASQMETSGCVAATNRAYQWRYQVIKPMFECREDHEILFDLADRLGFKEQYQKALYENAKKDGRSEFIWPDDATTEMAQSIRSIGLQGLSAKRLKEHCDNWHMFDSVTLEGKGPMKGQYYALPWPCWSEKHPGTPIMYADDIPVMKGGMGFRVNWGITSPDGASMLSARGLPNSKLKGHPAITADNIENILGIKLTKEEKELVKGTTFATDNTNILVEKALEAGVCPYGNGKARMVVWNWYDKIPLHREPIHSFRNDLIKKYPTFPDKKDLFRANIKYISRQTEKDWNKEFPLNMLTGRLVAHMGTGTETRSAKYLAEVQGEMFIEIHPDTALNLGVRDGDMVWVHGTSGTKILVKARHSYRVDENSVFLPQNFSGVYSGESLLNKYPKGTEPYAIGEAVSLITSYGFDYNTACPETKCGLCRIEKA